MFTWMFDGHLGVRCFFVISGFLITWLLIQENSFKGSVSLRSFYIRRGLRILPVYIGFALVLLLIQSFTPYSQTTEEWTGILTFTRNFTLQGTWISTHLWSLSIEEQFYVVWPIIFVLFGIAKKPMLPYALLAIPIAMAPVFRVLTLFVWSDIHWPVKFLDFYPAFSSFLKPYLPFYSSVNHFDSLAIGCCFAFVFARNRLLTISTLNSRPQVSFLISISLIIGPHVLYKFGWLGFIIGPFGSTLQAFGFGIGILHSVVMPQWGIYRSLNLPLVSWIGILSFSIYMWQQIFSPGAAAYGLESVWWLSFPGWLLPAFVTAFVSYYGLELPFVKLRSRFRSS